MINANVSVQSNSQLNCLLCFQEFKIPRVLPCLHSFCEKCLGFYILSNVGNTSEQITCPVCQEKCDPPNRNLSIDKWASSFLRNDIIVSIQELENETEESPRQCDPCRSEGEDVHAEFWCSNCRDKLCAECLRCHKRSKASKHHKTVLITEMDTKPNFILNFDRQCSCDRGQSIDMFCLDHKQMCCLGCSGTIHRGCGEMRDLDKTGKDLASRNMAANVLKDARNITESIQQLKDIRQRTESSFHADVDKSVKDMSGICNHLKQQIDTFQNQFLKNAKEISEKVNSKQRRNQENLHRFATNVEYSNQVFKLFNQYGDPKQNFIAYDATISQLNSHYARLKIEMEDEQDVRVSLEINTVSQELKNISTDLGKMNMSSTPSPSANKFVENMDGVLKTMATRTQLKSSVCAAQIVRPVDPLSLGVTHVRSMTQRAVTGGEAWFTGGTSLPNGHIVMADYNYNRLVEFDTEHKMVGQYCVDGKPQHVTSLGHDIYVSVRSGLECYIYQCRLDGGLIMVRQTTAPDDTKGLAVSVDGTIVIGTDRSVQVLSPSEKHVYKIQKSKYNDVAVSRTSTPLFYHTDGNSVVSRSIQDGKELYTYRHDNMQIPAGMCAGERGILYVCCNGSRNIHQISPNGQRGGVLLDSIHGITRPKAVLYNPHADQLVVTSDYGGDTVMAVYKLT